MDYNELQKYIEENNVDLPEDGDEIDFNVIDIDNVNAQDSKEIKKISEWEVLTPTGWSDFSSIKKITKPYCYEIKLSNGKELTGSPYHKIKMLDDSFQYLKFVKKGDLLVSGSKIISKKKIVKEIELFDLLDVEKGSEYFTNEIVSSNCAAISWMTDIWASAGLTLTRSQGSCIIISCVTDDTYVFTDNGIQQIKDFIPEDIDCSKKQTCEIEQYNVRGKDIKRQGSLFHVNGYCDTRKITTSFNSVESSNEHKYWSYKNGEYQWTKAKELEVGDWLCHQYGTDCWGNNDDISDFVNKLGNGRKEVNIPNFLTPDWCYFLGLYITKGSSSHKSITISCGDGITEIFDKLGLSYYKNPSNIGVSYEICRKILIEFLEYLGFDLSYTASKKQIPKRLMSISKENMKALLQGIFDGDGYSTIKKNRVGINLKSPLLIEQIRIILSNFGILSLLSIIPVEKMNSYYSKKGIVHRFDSHNLEIDGFFATKFHDEIGFRLERKANTRKSNKEVFARPIPSGMKIVRELCKIGKTSVDTIRTKHKIYIHYNSNPGRANIEKLINHISSTNEDFLNNERVKEIQDKVLIENSVWTQIKSIEEKQNYTYDFSLPETNDVNWCHSVVYNSIISHNTPKGSQGWYFDQYTNAEENGWNIIDAHWTEHPIYNLGLYRWKIDKNHPDGGTLEFMNGDSWPDMTNKKNVQRYKCKCKEEYNFIKDGKIRSPWYDIEAKKLGPRLTRCELDCSFAGSGGEVLDPEVIREHELIAKDIPQINEVKSGPYKNYKQYKPYVEGCKYILVSDVATGDGSDYSTFVIINLTTFEIVATYKDQFETTKFAEIIFEKAKEYGKALVIIEHQFGLSVLLVLRDFYKYTNIFYSTLKKDDPTTKDKKRKIGFWQSEKTRALGGDKLEEVLRTKELIIPCTMIINEMYTWVWSKRGRRDHAEGKHDDLLMSLTMACFYIFFIERKQADYRDGMLKTIERNFVNLGSTYSDDSYFDQLLE